MDTDTASDSEPHIPTGGAHLHTYISVDTDSEDGGMQLESVDGEMLHFAEDDSDIEFDERIMGVAMEEDRDGKYCEPTTYPSPRALPLIVFLTLININTWDFVNVLI
jgi:hypothetical protein